MPSHKHIPDNLAWIAGCPYSDSSSWEKKSASFSNRELTRKQTCLQWLLGGSVEGTSMKGWAPPPLPMSSAHYGDTTNEVDSSSEDEDDTSLASNSSSGDRELNGYVLSPNDERQTSCLAFPVGSYLFEVMCLRAQILLSCNETSVAATGRRPNG